MIDTNNEYVETYFSIFNLISFFFFFFELELYD